jgi:hypothetical protein
VVVVVVVVVVVMAAAAVTRHSKPLISNHIYTNQDDVNSTHSCVLEALALMAV